MGHNFWHVHVRFQNVVFLRDCGQAAKTLSWQLIGPGFKTHSGLPLYPLILRQLSTQGLGTVPFCDDAGV